jgi:hypothetical protein
MRTTAIGILVATALAAGGCGGSTQSPSQPRPPVPVEESVFIDNTRVTLSPSVVGAGPIMFIVTNQASKTESLTIAPAGAGTQALASTGPINPQATAQVTVTVSSPGDYTVGTGPTGTTEAALATQSGIRSAALHVGPMRPSGDNALLLP